MSRETILDSIGRIDDDLILAVDAFRRKRERPVRKNWSALAACLCLAVLGAVILPRIADVGSPGIPVQDDAMGISSTHTTLHPSVEEDVHPGTEQAMLPRIPWTIQFNEATSMLTAHRAYIKAMFTEPLTETELSALRPHPDLNCSGYAEFDDRGNLLNVVMQIPTSLPESPVTVALADSYFGFEYVLPGEEVVSVCNQVAYRVYQYESGNTVTLSARAIINDIYFVFSMDTTQAQLAQAKEAFQLVLEHFACYEEGKPVLSVIVPEAIPELNEQFFDSLSEARTESDFGRYLPFALPDGFCEAAIRRFQFQDSNDLSAFWSRGFDYLDWVVSPYTEEDAHRLTDIDDPENYDLSLYPIPRADTVPDALREIVDDPIFEADELTLEAVYSRAYRIHDSGDTDGWRMKFSVRYADILVSVSAKGVEPEWLYHQLAMLRSDR